MLETEVTVGMRRSFVKATNYQMGSGTGGGGMYGVTEDGTMLLNPKYTWENPGYPQTARHPVVGVDWPGAVAFCEWLAKETGLPVRLPTEAEWEYACRAGTTTAYSFGNAPEDLTEYGNVADKSAKTKFPHWGWSAASDDGYAFTAPVRNFKPNSWGLYDMRGNVWERRLDYYAEEHGATSLVDPTGPAAGSRRVLRGGSWTGAPRRCRAAYRVHDAPTLRNGGNGFRVVIEGEIKTSAVPAPVPAAEPFLWLERAAKAGNVDGLRAVFLFYDGENPEIAGAALEKFATRPDCKDASAKFALAVAYAYGYGVEQDAKKAFALYKKATDAGAPRGMSEVARCYENGVGVERSAAEAAKWRERAGNAPAFFIEPAPGAENLAPPRGLRLSDLGLFVGRRIPRPPVADLPAGFPVLREPVAAPAARRADGGGRERF